MKTWKEYFEKTKGAKPRDLLVKGIGLVRNKNKVLDLGAGVLNDVWYFLSIGFNHVTAVDKTAVEDNLLKDIPKDKFTYVVSLFEEFDFTKDTYDLVSSQYALPFNPQATFKRVFNDLKDSLKVGGIFVGQLFGDKDEWNTKDGSKTFHTKEEVQDLFKDFNLIECTEEDKHGPTVAGYIKRWHTFKIIAEKK